MTSSKPNRLPKAPPANPIILSLAREHVNLEGDTEHPVHAKTRGKFPHPRPPVSPSSDVSHSYSSLSESEREHRFDLKSVSRLHAFYSPSSVCARACVRAILGNVITRKDVIKYHHSRDTTAESSPRSSLSLSNPSL